jgi:hypothetical protein
MIPFYLSLAALSFLSFAGAEPLHIPLVRTSTPPTMDNYVAAADALKTKYGFNPPTTSKRQNTASVSIINQVSRFSAREILVRF